MVVYSKTTTYNAPLHLLQEGQQCCEIGCGNNASTVCAHPHCHQPFCSSHVSKVQWVTCCLGTVGCFKKGTICENCAAPRRQKSCFFYLLNIAFYAIIIYLIVSNTRAGGGTDEGGGGSSDTKCYSCDGCNDETQCLLSDANCQWTDGMCSSADPDQPSDSPRLHS
jgi:hypothetical protein